VVENLVTAPRPQTEGRAPSVAPVQFEVIVLNGGSSSGKSSIAASLQAQLDGTWLALGVDDLIRALSHGPLDMSAGGTFEITPEGSVVVGEAFRAAELAWYEGLAAVARAGTSLIVDEVFLDGAASQERLRAALGGLSVLWVGVRCDAAVAEARELQRTDRNIGMARDQAERVHRGVHYDLVVETDDVPPGESARSIVTWIRSRS
jgi:chloramphenicol 3-O phosphotransferase